MGWDGEAGVLERAAVGGGRGLEMKSGLVVGTVPGKVHCRLTPYTTLSFIRLSRRSRKEKVESHP